MFYDRNCTIAHRKRLRSCTLAKLNLTFAWLAEHSNRQRMMTDDIIRSWREIKVMLKLRYSVLTDVDFAFKEDHRETMLDQLAVKLNKTRVELETVLMELQKY